MIQISKTDPLIGFFVSKTNTRFGKLRPWILFSAPFSILCYMAIWFVPGTDDKSLKTVWYLVFYCLFQTFLSVSSKENKPQPIHRNMFIPILFNSVCMFLTLAWQWYWHQAKPSETRRLLTVSVIKIFSNHLVFSKSVLHTNKGMCFEIIGTLLAAGIQGLMLSIVGSTTSCKVTLAAFYPTEPNMVNSTESLMHLEAPQNATGKDKLVRIKQNFK